MEISRKLTLKLIKENILNKHLLDGTADYLANMLLEMCPSSINAMIETAVSNTSPLLLKKGDLVLYRQTSSWKIKELGSLDALVDAKQALIVERNDKSDMQPGILYLGKVLDSSSYGEFTQYDSKYLIETYGLTDDLEQIVDSTDVECTDIAGIYGGDNL